ncbi:MAG: energy-coupling factor transporter transmembrane protein EcfT [Firmicutes bacterium]|nr:energy-coupling factor transporter transmembrane protein EcfT [Bacillota bacterium]
MSKPASTGMSFYSGHRSPFCELHPGVRLIWLISQFFLAFIFQHPLILLGLFLLNVSIAVWARMSAVMTRLFCLAIGIGAAITMLTWMPFMPLGTPLVSFEIPIVGWNIRVTDIGIMWGAAMGLRIAVSTLPFFVILSSTSPKEITVGASKVGIPYTASFLFAMAFRFLPMAQNDAAVIQEAVSVRGLRLSEGSFATRVKKYGMLLGPLIFTSLRRVQLVANALDSKGFRSGHEFRFYHERPWTLTEKLLVSGIGVVLIVSFVVTRVYGFGLVIPGRI